MTKIDLTLLTMVHSLARVTMQNAGRNGTSVEYQSGGNVGIGTTGPTSPLHIDPGLSPPLKRSLVECL